MLIAWASVSLHVPHKKKNQSTEGTVMAVVQMMLSFWKRLPNSLESSVGSPKEFETYTKAILYRRIVFIIVDLLFYVIIFVLLVIAFQIYHIQTPRS